ncbi:MAG: endolytic transglycosylase MltG [Candidatus Magasanikbacteria bacterium]
MKKLFFLIILFCAAVGVWFMYSEIHTAEAALSEKISFQVQKDESVSALADRLAEEQVIRNSWLFKKYIAWKGVDKDVRFGTFEVETPITLERVIEALKNPSAGEKEITIIPGWNIRDIAQYFEREGMFQSEEITELIGLPVHDYRSGSVPGFTFQTDVLLTKSKPDYVSFEGYLSPDTFRIIKDATLDEIVEKLVRHRDQQFTEQMYLDIEKAGRTPHEILTLASIVEREVMGEKDKKIVADIFLRRLEMNWALQADSTVHYAVGKSGNVFTSKEDRDSLSLWNTYKYPGLPPGPISNPSFGSIMAAIYPEPNEYYYFLTDMGGEVHYGKTLEEHNANRAKYL